MQLEGPWTVNFTMKPPQAPLLGTYPGKVCCVAPAGNTEQSGVMY
jgi:hypothetical protein